MQKRLPTPAEFKRDMLELGVDDGIPHLTEADMEWADRMNQAARRRTFDIARSVLQSCADVAMAQRVETLSGQTPGKTIVRPPFAEPARIPNPLEARPPNRAQRRANRRV